MGFLESPVWRIFSSSQKDRSHDKSPSLFATPSHSSMSRFSLPSADHSSSSSNSSLSSSSTFWLSPKRSSPWSPKRYIPSNVRNAVTKRQVAVVVCLVFALLVWTLPPPTTWRRHVVHVALPGPITSPYQVLRPLSATEENSARNPVRWLDHNSNNRYALGSSSRLKKSITELTHASPRPRAALISLVRNSELQGLLQSMRQLEFHWNRKYQYPWIFFNDEPFSDEFKVSLF